MAQGKTTLVAFRFENELLRRIDAFAKSLEEQTRGIKLARAGAVRVLMLRGLAEAEKVRKQK
jgi:hypothetical protein